LINDDILLELDQVDLGVEQSHRTLGFAVILAAGISDVLVVGLRIGGTEVQGDSLDHLTFCELGC